MRLVFADSRAAMILRRLRGRFGIAAPRVAVRTHVPWYWRAAGAVIAAAVALALAGWIYDAGRRFAGFDRSASESEIAALRDDVVRLETETERLRVVANASESNLQIERTTRDQLTRQVKSLEEESVRLKESLAVFENLASGGSKDEAINLSRLRIEPDSPEGRYRYRVLVSRQGVRTRQDFVGDLQLYVTVVRPLTGEGAIIVVPRPDDPDAARFAVAFRNFRSLEGSFDVPADARIKRVEVRLVQQGVVRASQSVTL